MIALQKGRYGARYAQTDADFAAIRHLRGLVFRGDPKRNDEDGFDHKYNHLMVEDDQNNLVAYTRLYLVKSPQELQSSYSAQSYDLSQLVDFEKPMMEVGRFCLHPDHADPEIQRIIWGAITKRVDDHDIQLLFGCSSFLGTDPTKFRSAFMLLDQKYVGPQGRRPGVKAKEVVKFSSLAEGVLDHKAGLKSLPSLLKTYLVMGAWVSDHLVIDRDLKTMHVFTALEISSIPAARAKALRDIAQ